MTDFTKTTNFTTKDNLTTGNALKVIKGSLFDTEFDNIATAITSKYDSNDLASQAEAEAGTNNLTLITPLRAEQHITTWAGENDGMVADIQGFDFSADALLGWDQSASAAIGFTLGDGLAFSTTTLHLEHLGFQDLEDAGADKILFWDDGAGATAWLAPNTALSISGTDLNFDFSGLTNRAIVDTQPTDSFVFNNGGVMEQIDIQDMGIRTVNLSTTQTFALGDANTLQLLTGATARAWTIPTNASVAFGVGTLIYLGSRDAGEIAVTVGGSVTLTSIFSNGVSTDDDVLSNGLAVLVKVGADEWMLSGDIRD